MIKKANLVPIQDVIIPYFYKYFNQILKTQIVMLSFKNLFLNQKIQKSLNLAGLAIILWAFYFTCSGLFYVMKAPFTGQTFTLDGLEKTLAHIFPVHAALLMVPIYLMLFALFRKHFKFWYWVVATIGGFIIPSYELFDNYLHPLLFSFHIFDFILRPGQHILNPQYTKLFVYFILSAILLFLNIRKKTRSADRIFVLLISGVVLVTTLIFHIAVPMGFFNDVRHEVNYNIAREASAESEDVLCQNRDCFWLDNNFNLLKKNDVANPQLLKTYSYFLDGGKQSLQNEKQVYTFPLGDFQGQRFDYIIPAMKKTDSGYFVMMDENVMKKYSRNSEIWFAFLASAAHGIWIFGGMSLMFLHKQRFFRKLSPRMNKPVTESVKPD